MALVNETNPGTPVVANQKGDIQSVPTGADDNWWAAADANKLLGFGVATDRAIRVNALIARITASSETLATPVMTAFTGVINAVSELRQVSKDFTTPPTNIPSDLNKIFTDSIAVIEEGGDRLTVAVSTGLYAIQQGAVTIVSGSLGITGTLLSFGTSGQLATWNGGATAAAQHAPIGFVINATTAYVNTNRRWMADNSSVEFANESGVPVIRIKSGASLTLGTVTMNTLNLLSSGQVNGTEFIDQNRNMIVNDLEVSGAFSADLFRGEMYTVSNLTLLTGVQQSFVTIPHFDTSGDMHQVTFVSAEPSLQVLKAGTYYVHMEGSFRGANGITYTMAVHKNGTEQQNMRLSRELTGIGNIGAGGLVGLVLLSVNDKLDLRVKTDSGANNFGLVESNVIIFRVGK